MPDEQWLLAISTGGDYTSLKGVIEGLLEALHVTVELVVKPQQHELFGPDRYTELWLAGQKWGVLGELNEQGLNRFDLRGRTTIAELRLSLLEKLCNLVPKYRPLPQYPAIRRDLNLVVDDAVRFSELAATIRASAGALLEDLQYRETYRSGQLGAGKKSLLLTVTLRDANGTLKSEQADEVRSRVVVACGERHGAQLRA